MTIRTIDDQIAALEKLRGVLPDTQIEAKLAELRVEREMLAAQTSAGNTLNANDITAGNVVVGMQTIVYGTYPTGDAADVALTLPPLGHALVPLLVDYFSTSEIESLCFDLGVDRDRLRAQTKDELARALVLHAAREGQLDELKGKVLAVRPNLRSQLPE